jgi:hypothetical protein
MGLVPKAFRPAIVGLPGVQRKRPKSAKSAKYQESLRPNHTGTFVIRNDLAGWIGEAGDAAGARDLLAALFPGLERGPEAETPKSSPPARSSPSRLRQPSGGQDGGDLRDTRGQPRGAVLSRISDQTAPLLYGDGDLTPGVVSEHVGDRDRGIAEPVDLVGDHLDVARLKERGEGI